MIITIGKQQLAWSWAGMFLCIALGVGLSGCTGSSGRVVSPLSSSLEGTYDSSGVLRSFRLDQEKRRRLPQWWWVDGQVEISLKDEARRHRVELFGQRGQFVRMRIFGPFNNIAMELTMVPEWLRLVNPGDRALFEVSADSFGMESLTGLAFNPGWLYPAIVACAADLHNDAEFSDQTLSGENRVGEKLWVDASTGLVLQRSRFGVDGKVFFVDYGWPEVQRPAQSNLPRMPERVEIRLADDGSRLTLSLKEWKFFNKKPGNFPELEKVPAFQVFYPEIGDGKAQ